MDVDEGQQLARLAFRLADTATIVLFVRGPAPEGHFSMLWSPRPCHHGGAWNLCVTSRCTRGPCSGLKGSRALGLLGSRAGAGSHLLRSTESKLVLVLPAATPSGLSLELMEFVQPAGQVSEADMGTRSHATWLRQLCAWIPSELRCEMQKKKKRLWVVAQQKIQNLQ